MLYKFTTKNGRNLGIDLTKWKIDETSKLCTIIDINEGIIVLENKHKDRFTLPECLIKDNDLEVVGNMVELTDGLYDYHFLKKFKEHNLNALDTLYHKYASLIFQNRDLVLNKAEYYLLKPRSLCTRFMYLGGITYSLGNLFESFESGNHVIL